VDSFEVWVGAPREAGIYDPAHRYLSDTIDFGLSGSDAPKMIYSLTGVSSGHVSQAIPGGASWSTVRVVLRVKTNRFFERAARVRPRPVELQAHPSLRHEVNVNGTLSDFETASQILPRFNWTDLGGGAADVAENSPSDSWITTGRQPARYGHIENVANLPYGDPGGGLYCNLQEYRAAIQPRDRTTSSCPSRRTG
jgi:hypothetical protein